jgi:hypothetical protein
MGLTLLQLSGPTGDTGVPPKPGIVTTPVADQLIGPIEPEVSPNH